jgi:hypothetical protein
MHRCPWEAAALAAITLLSAASSALAHGFAGQRFFPATLLTDDPFVADEMSLPTFTRPPTASDGTFEYDLDIDLAKRLTLDLGFTAHYGWADMHSRGMPAVSGFGPLQTGLQYQLFVDAPHEAIGLANLSVTWAHTARVQALGAPDFTTLSPGFDFGKGFGDLPASLPFLRPFAITGNLGFDFPTKTESAGVPNPDNFTYGFAFEYSLPYLQCCVKDVGLQAPFSQLIPLVEIALSTPINRIAPGVMTTGTVQPGIIWSGPYFQVGAEAIIPVNRATGKGLGALVQLHFYLDDLFPHSIGRPVSEWLR